MEITYRKGPTYQQCIYTSKDISKNCSSLFALAIANSICSSNLRIIDWHEFLSGLVPTFTSSQNASKRRKIDLNMSFQSLLM
jgi:hypothetical protein